MAGIMARPTPMPRTIIAAAMGDKGSGADEQERNGPDDHDHDTDQRGQAGSVPASRALGTVHPYGRADALGDQHQPGLDGVLPPPPGSTGEAGS